MTGKDVKRRLDELGIRQIDLAKKWKLSTATVNKFVNREFTSERLDKRLARELRVTVEELRGETKQPEQAA